MPDSRTKSAAYGGPGWSPRRTSLEEELGTVWATCGLQDEWGRLRAVLLHMPGPEWASLDDANAVQMLDRPDLERARSQHRALQATYESLGMRVEQVRPAETPSPNLLFVADLFAMTPSGAILGRPASTVRAGEERWVARRLADLGVPIRHSVGARGTFEGADLLWLERDTALLGLGLRTNAEAADQLAFLAETVRRTVLPAGTMHLMGQLRILDRDLAVVWPGRLAPEAITMLRNHGYEVAFIQDETEATVRAALNVVTVGPREIVMPAGCPRTQRFFESLGVKCHTVAIDELAKAAGGIACMTGILHREPGAAAIA